MVALQPMRLGAMLGLDARYRHMRDGTAVFSAAFAERAAASLRPARPGRSWHDGFDAGEALTARSTAGQPLHVATSTSQSPCPAATDRCKAILRHALNDGSP
jgi:hypothetical protein